MAFFPQWYVRASHWGACRRGELPEMLLFGTLIDWEIVAREVGTGGQIAAGEEMAVVENAAGEIAAGENSVGERSAWNSCVRKKNRGLCGHWFPPAV